MIDLLALLGIVLGIAAVLPSIVLLMRIRLTREELAAAPRGWESTED